MNVASIASPNQPGRRNSHTGGTESNFAKPAHIGGGETLNATLISLARILARQAAAEFLCMPTNLKSL